MTVICIWHGDDPTEDPSLDSALTRIAERAGDLRYVIEVDEDYQAMTYFSADQIADFLEARRQEIELDRRHDRSLVRYVMFG